MRRKPAQADTRNLGGFFKFSITVLITSNTRLKIPQVQKSNKQRIYRKWLQYLHTFIEDVHLTDVCFVKADSIPLHPQLQVYIMQSFGNTQFVGNLQQSFAMLCYRLCQAILCKENGKSKNEERQVAEEEGKAQWGQNISEI